MGATSRPLRALVIVLALWVGVRMVTTRLGIEPAGFRIATADAVTGHRGVRQDFAQAGNSASHPQAVRPAVSDTAESYGAARVVARPRQAAAGAPPFKRTAGHVRRLRLPTVTGSTSVAIAEPDHPSTMPPHATATAQGYATSPRELAAMMPTIPPARRQPKSGLRIDGSFWLLARNAGGSALATGGELGGSQAGVRVNAAVAGPIFVTGRFSTPLARANGREASVGLGLRKGNFGLLLERRIALDSGARNDFSVTAYGGVSDVRLTGNLRLEAYGQVGIVGSDGFADGAASVSREVKRLGKARLSLGVAAWGGIQPGVRRLDAGPQAVLRVPLDNRSVRISAEWRQRIAGNAAPTSGPSLTVGIDF